jgi:hypothetical protein
VAHRVLAGGGLEGHRPVGRDQAVGAVAAAGLAVVAGLGGGAGDGEVDEAAGVVVAGVDGDLDARRRAGARRAGGDRAGARARRAVRVEVREVPADHGARHREPMRAVLAHAEHLHVLAERRVVAPHRGRLERALRRQHRGLERRERREADPDRGVVGERSRPARRRAHQLHQLGGARPHAAGEPHVGARVEGVQVRGEPALACLAGQVLHRHRHAAPLAHGAARPA